VNGEQRVNSHPPRAALRAGVIITAAGAAVLVPATNIIPNLVLFAEPSGQAFLGLISVVLDAIRFLAIPLGCALIAAGLVMRYVWSLHLQGQERDDHAQRT
jgi:hypothetical protein